MRVVRDLGDLDGEIDGGPGRGRSRAFGDGDVFVEPYVERGRHVEVQVLADTHGTVWALGERDCSLQRRHQKVVEEAPAPGDRAPTLRARAARGGRRAAAPIDYVGAGTVEFLVDARTARRSSSWR